MADDQGAIHVLFVDDEVVEKIVPAISAYRGSDSAGEIVECDGFRLHFHYESDLDRARDAIRFGRPPAHVVVLDVEFKGEQERNGLWLLERIKEMTPDIPVIVTTEVRFDAETGHLAGKRSADLFLSKARFLSNEPDDIERLILEIARVRDVSQFQPELHDREHEGTANEFAEEYDKEEQDYPATVAYYMFENEIILGLVGQILADQGQVRICDVGCGTGRIEECIDTQFDLEKDNIHITAVDFAPAMLDKLAEKSVFEQGDHFRIERGSAERLAMLEDETFDLVILAFGVPSYTRYFLSLREAARICKPGGFALFSVYNEDSVIYEAMRKSDWGPEERPVAAIADPKTGKLVVGGGKREFDCETFSINAFNKLLSRNSFELENNSTFPTLHVSLSRTEITKMPDAGQHPGFHHCGQFSNVLYDLDVRASETNNGRGHYIVTTAKKR